MKRVVRAILATALMLALMIPAGFLVFEKETPTEDWMFDELGIDGYEEIGFMQNSDCSYLASYSNNLPSVVDNAYFEISGRRAYPGYDDELYGEFGAGDYYAVGNVSYLYEYEGSVRSVLYYIEYFAYMNSEAISGLIGLVIIGALLYKRFFRKRGINKTAAALISAALFVLLALKCIGEYYWWDLMDLLAPMIASLFGSLVLFFILIVGKPGEAKPTKKKDALFGAFSPTRGFMNTGSKENVNSRPYTPPARRRSSDETAWNENTFLCPCCGATLLDRSEFCYKCNTQLSERKEVQGDPWD